LQILLQHFIGIYTLYSFFIWPKEVANKEELNKLHSILFETTKEIQVELSQVFPYLHQSTMIDEIVRDVFLLKTKTLYETIINLESAGIGEYGEEILDLLWKIGLRFVPDALLEDPHVLPNLLKPSERKMLMIKLAEGRMKDWRNIVKDYVNRLPPKQKVWPKAVSDKY
jgi:hypothetical protein